MNTTEKKNQVMLEAATRAGITIKSVNAGTHYFPEAEFAGVLKEPLLFTDGNRRNAAPSVLVSAGDYIVYRHEYGSPKLRGGQGFVSCDYVAYTLALGASEETADLARRAILAYQRNSRVYTLSSLPSPRHFYPEDLWEAVNSDSYKWEEFTRTAPRDEVVECCHSSGKSVFYFWDSKSKSVGLFGTFSPGEYKVWRAEARVRKAALGAGIGEAALDAVLDAAAGKNTVAAFRSYPSRATESKIFDLMQEHGISVPQVEHTHSAHVFGTHVEWCMSGYSGGTVPFTAPKVKKYIPGTAVFEENRSRFSSICTSASDAVMYTIGGGQPTLTSDQYVAGRISEEIDKKKKKWDALNASQAFKADGVPMRVSWRLLDVPGMSASLQVSVSAIGDEQEIATEISYRLPHCYAEVQENDVNPADIIAAIGGSAWNKFLSGKVASCR